MSTFTSMNIVRGGLPCRYNDIRSKVDSSAMSVRRRGTRGIQRAPRATSTVTAPSARDVADTQPSAAALRTALTTEICPEHITEVECTVSGEVPMWLSGLLLRNGPGTYKGKKHLFDGYAMLVKFRIDGGAVHVSNRFVESNAWKAFRDTGEPAFAEFGTPLPSLLKSIKNIFTEVSGLGQGFTDNSNVRPESSLPFQTLESTPSQEVSVMPSPDGKTAVCMTEAVSGTYQLDMETLATRGSIKFRDSVKGALTTAHPTLMADGSIINLTSDIGKGYTVFRSRVGSDVREVVAELPLSNFPAPSWIHDFPCTANYVVIPETPAFFNIPALSVGAACEYVVMDWQPELGTQITLVPLNGDLSGIRRFTMPAYFTFHYVNAFESEDGTELSFDFGYMTNPGMLNNLRLDEMRQRKESVLPGPLKRVTVPLDGRTEVKVTSLMKDDSAYVQAELPRVNPLFKGKPYRYAYSISAKPPCCADNALTKYDVELGVTKSWFEPGSLPTEPLMVPRPGGNGEDDGAVLSVVTGADGRSFLLILDAGSFEEVARAYLGFNVPYQFHGSWFSTA